MLSNPPNPAEEWLRYARSDLALAQADVPGVLPELLCFHAQQAASWTPREKKWPPGAPARVDAMLKDLW